MGLHGVCPCMLLTVLLHVDITALATQRSASPVQTVTAPTTVSKSTVATKPTLAPKPREDSHPEPVVMCDTTVRQADVG